MTSRDKIALGAGVGVVVLQVVIGAAVYFAFKDWPSRGTFGDMFGVVTALFSGLALGGVIYAILLQAEELSLQRAELELTRRELEKSAQAQERSAVLLERQLSLSQAEATTRRAAARPILRLEWGSQELTGLWLLATTNIGGMPREMMVEESDNATVKLVTGDPKEPRLVFFRVGAANTGGEIPSIVRFKLRYMDEQARIGTMLVAWDRDNKELHTL
jgi:hypothetical protein